MGGKQSQLKQLESEIQTLSKLKHDQSVFSWPRACLSLNYFDILLDLRLENRDIGLYLGFCLIYLLKNTLSTTTSWIITAQWAPTMDCSCTLKSLAIKSTFSFDTFIANQFHFGAYGICPRWNLGRQNPNPPFTKKPDSGRSRSAPAGYGGS